MSKTKSKEPLKRVTAGIVGAALIIGMVMFSEWTYITLFLVICTASLIEYHLLIRKREVQTNIIPAVISGVFVFCSPFLIMKGWMEAKHLIIFAGFIYVLFFWEILRKNLQPFRSLAYSVLGVLYIGLSLGLFHLAAYYDGSYNELFVLGIFVLIWSNDTGAYIAGVSFGKNKLFMRISPKKTWEGSIGGAFLTLFTGFLLSLFSEDILLKHWLIIALLIIITASLGDLVESYFKRSINVKDSGSVIPGHGGFLDRFDGFFLSAPFITLYVVFFL